MTYLILLLLLVALVQVALIRRANAGSRSAVRRRQSWITNPLGWGLLLFLATLLSLFFLDALPAPEMAPRGRQRLQERRAEARLAEADNRLLPNLDSVTAETERQLFERTFPSGWQASGSLQQIRHEEVMHVRPPAGMDPEAFRERAPYYLRGLVLSEFNERGSQAAIPPGLPLFVDEDHDGWVKLAERSGHEEIELVVEQVPLIVRRGAWNVLFAPRPLHEIQTDRVLYEADSLLALPAASDEGKTTYATRASDLRFDRDCPARRNSGTPPSEECIALPPPGPTLTFLEQTAKAWTEGARSDEERVRKIVNHFRAEFAYAAISADVPGLEGIRNFLELERGYCTYFAAGTTLLLRTLGIPSRVATGFLAEQWDEESGAFVVTTQNGHAWVEVWFEGIGWLRVDPTPGSRRLRALGRLGEGPAGLREWASTFGSDLRFLLGSGVRSADLNVLRDTVATLPTAFARSVARRPFLFGIGLSGLFLALLWNVLRTRPHPGQARPMTRTERVTQDLEERFRAALRARGGPSHDSATLRELSRSVGAGENLAEDLARLRYSANAPSTETLQQLRARVLAFEV